MEDIAEKGGEMLISFSSVIKKNSMISVLC